MNNFPLALQKPRSDVCIRPVTIADVPLLKQYIWQDRTSDAISDFLKRTLKSTEQKRGLGIVVCGSDACPIIAYGQVSYWGTTAEISDLIVHSDYRSRGYGTAMIQYLTHRVYEHGIPSAEIGVAEHNTRALTLYRRLGFQDSYYLELDLGNGIEPVCYLRLYFNNWH